MRLRADALKLNGHPRIPASSVAFSHQTPVPFPSLGLSSRRKFPSAWSAYLAVEFRRGGFLRPICLSGIARSDDGRKSESSVVQIPLAGDRGLSNSRPFAPALHQVRHHVRHSSSEERRRKLRATPDAHPYDLWFKIPWQKPSMLSWRGQDGMTLFLDVVYFCRLTGASFLIH